MKTTMNYVNTLPVNTWNHLKVNESTLEFEVPNNINQYQSSENLAAISKDLQLEGTKLKDVKQQLMFALKDKGNELVDFMYQHSNANAHLYVTENKMYKEPVILSYTLDENNTHVFDENIIYAEEGSEITVLLHYQSNKTVKGVHGSMTSLYAKKNAKIHLIQVQLLNEETVHFDHIRGYAHEGASIDIVQIELGGAKNFVGSEVVLAADRASYDNKVIYLGTGKQTIDMNYLAKHYGKSSKSNIISKGCLDDESEKIFRATIDFKRGCSYASGAEHEETLLLSPKVKNKSVPLILCGEDNVAGAHAANIGKLEENQMFYLMSRGLSELEAKQLLILSRFNNIYQNIPDEIIKEQVEHFIKRSLYDEKH